MRQVFCFLIVRLVDKLARHSPASIRGGYSGIHVIDTDWLVFGTDVYTLQQCLVMIHAVCAFG